MLVTTALHLVPDPDDEPPAPEAGEQPALAPVPADGLDPDGAETPGEEDGDEDEAPAPRALALPDLSPYTDLSWIPQVINAGIEGARRYRRAAPERKAKRAAAKATRREVDRAVNKEMRGRLLTIAVDVASGSLHLLRHLRAWLKGEYGPKSLQAGGRLGLTAFTAYCTYRAVGTWPLYAPVGIVVLWLAAALGAAHRRRAEQGAKKPSGKAPVKVEKKAGPPPAAAPVEAPVEVLADGPEDTPAGVPEEDPLTAFLRAQIGTENGVHLEDLRPAMRAHFPHLQQATDKELREVLKQAGYEPSQKFRARGVAGRQGVHRNQLPPVPSPDGAPGPSPDHSPQGGDRRRPANLSAAESGGEQPGEGRRGAGERKVDIVPDPERGPAAWRVVHHGED